MTSATGGAASFPGYLRALPDHSLAASARPCHRKNTPKDRQPRRSSFPSAVHAPYAITRRKLLELAAKPCDVRRPFCGMVEPHEHAIEGPEPDPLCQAGGTHVSLDSRPLHGWATVESEPAVRLLRRKRRQHHRLGDALPDIARADAYRLRFHILLAGARYVFCGGFSRISRCSRCSGAPARPRWVLLPK